MAGIRLPDIGKLGIRIATGIRDRKKVAPGNMAEDAKLKSLSRKLDNEKQERHRNLKKEEKRMKRKKQVIDKRRGIIGLNSPPGAKPGGKLPPIAVPPQGCEKQKTVAEDEVIHNGNDARVMFPIQNALGLGNSESRKGIPDLVQFSCSPSSRGAKVILPSLEIQGRTSRSSKKNAKRKTSFDTKGPGYFINREVNDDKQKSEPVEQDSVSRPPEFTDEILGNGSQSFTERSPHEGNDIRGNYSGDRKRAAQQSLEEAFLAIQACRYIRTPSKQKFKTEN